MKKMVAFCAVVIAAMLMALPVSHAAARKAPAAPTEIQQAGSVIKTKYFNLTIPQGWMMPQPVKQQPRDGISAVFASEKGNVAITINVMQVALSAKEIAAQTAANMQKSGLKTTPPVEKNGFWVIDVEGKAKGNAWFGSNGKICAVTTVFGYDTAAANALLGSIQEADAKLIPSVANY